jgi:hypothetical protein
MITIAVVLTLTSEREERQAAIKSLRELSDVTLGRMVGNRLPVAIQTDSERGDADLWRQVRRSAGILHAEVVFAEVGTWEVESGC